MLKLRVITALVIAPFVIFATLALPHSGFAFLAALIFVMGAWEWAGLSGLSASGRWGYAGLLAASFAFIYSFNALHAAWSWPVVIAGLVWWIAAFLLVLTFPSGSGFWRGAPAKPAMAGVLVLVPAWTALVALHAADRQLTLLLLFLTSFADIGAYFAGRAFGRRKLAPQVSPGKTWEGLAGALVVTVLIAAIALQLLGIAEAIAVTFVALCVVTVLVSVLGDLIESMFKRMAGAKDSGGLLPGHGGVLDRIDSITAAAPVFAFGLHYFGVTA